MKFLPVLEKYRNRYEFFVKFGKESLAGKRIVFGTLTRNSSSRIVNNLNMVASLGESCEDYKIVVYENDSEDNTKQILKDVSSSNKNIQIIGTDYNRPSFGPVKSQERIKYLTQYRDELKSFICNNYSNYDYVVIFDSDFDEISIDGLYNSFGYIHSYNLDCMAGTSYQIRPVFGKEYNLWNYDSWAFKLNDWDCNSNQEISQYQKYPSDLWFGFFILPNGSSIYRALSAFGGSAIYKMDIYKHGTYSREPFNQCDHVLFHKDLYTKTGFKLFVNPSQIMLMPTES
jgi:hypothetical protein